ncbi:MAG: Tetratricopeptide 2 repeat protein [Verrucomicrobiales bacterium]|nr:Tetratricopeptide 2 repeat protein [Verrucomicrobiales bacterium]
MEAESTNTHSHFDLMAWLATNFKLVIIGAGAVLVVGAGIGVYSWSKEQSEIKANEQLFAVPSIGLAKPTGSAENYLKTAQDNSGSPVGDRAELLAAGVLFQQGKYSEARAQFEKVLKNQTDASLQSEAALGLASCLDAEGKASDATTKYLDVISRFGTTPAASQSKLSLGRLYETQGKPEEALKYYEQLDKSANQYDAWRAAGVEKREQLLSKHPELAKAEPQLPPDQIIEVTTPPEGSTNAPIIRTNPVITPGK